MSWWQYSYPAVVVLAAALTLEDHAIAIQPSDEMMWRPSTRTVSMQTATATAPCGICPISTPPAGGVRYREETYTVRRPVIETSMREERYVRYEPVTTFVPQQVDQGAWINQQVVRPGRTTTRLRWFDGGWTVDPATGREYWRLPMWRPVKIRQPDKVEMVRVWKPNLVTMSVPKVSYQPQVHIRQVPVQTVRYVEERRVRQVPVGCGGLWQRLIAPGASAPTPTFDGPLPNTVPPVVSDPTVPMSTPAGNAPLPLPNLPKPEIDPHENVPGPSIIPQNQPSGEGSSLPNNGEGRSRVT